MKLKNIKKQYLTAKAVQEFRQHSEDVGSAEVQIATLTFRINELSHGHMKDHRKDFASVRGLKKLSSTRKKLMRYLKNTDFSRYLAISAKLHIK